MAGFEVLADAWSTWWAGNVVDNDLLIWGVSLRWWNRIGQMVQLPGILVLVLEVVGEERLACFRTWTLESLFPDVFRLYKRFALSVLKTAAWTLKRVERLQQFRTLLILSLTLTAIILIPYGIVRLIQGPVVAGAVLHAFLLSLEILWAVIELFFRVIILLIVVVQLVLFVPTLLVITVAHLLSRRYTGVVVRLGSTVLFLFGTFFGVLAS